MLKDIKSKYILEQIFNHINTKSKLKIIKYNKNISQKINITLEEYKIYNKIKILNENFELNIKDNNLEELNLSHKRLGTKSESFKRINISLELDFRYKTINKCKIRKIRIIKFKL